MSNSLVRSGVAARVAGADLVSSRPWADVVNPADLSVVARVACAESAQLDHAVAVAVDAAPACAETSGVHRGAALRSIAQDLRSDCGQLARLITAESGKRLVEAEAEVELSARYLEWFAGLARKSGGTPSADGRAQVDRVPAGVAAAITTWNFPLSIPVRKIAAALAAGCSVILKPSPLAPVSAWELVRRCEPHLPGGAIGVVLGGAEQAAALVEADDVRAVSFTGSTEAGVALAGRLVGTLTRSVLELGGRAPVVVLDDASVDTAVELIMVAKFRNNGASCIAANNVFVHRRLLDPVLAELERRVSEMVPTDPTGPWPSTLGPLRTPDHARAIEKLAAEAESRGCRVVRGPAPVSPSPCFTSAVLVHADRPTSGWETEVFGPLLQVRGFDDEDAVVTEVNGWRRGLGGYVASDDRERATALARRLRVGIVGIGTGTPNSPELPFGGFDLAGWGREGSAAGLDPFQEAQTIAYGE